MYYAPMYIGSHNTTHFKLDFSNAANSHVYMCNTLDLFKCLNPDYVQFVYLLKRELTKVISTQVKDIIEHFQFLNQAWATGPCMPGFFKSFHPQMLVCLRVCVCIHP